jgi:UTP-glucose-1-phosphate uridylyltransferase
MHSITHGLAKELLPVDGKPVIEHVLDEATKAGAAEIIVVSSPRKAELNAWLNERSDVTVTYQHEPKGLGDALTCGSRAEPALVLLPDTLFTGTAAALHLAESSQPDAVKILVQEVAEDDRHRYGIVEADQSGLVHRVLEKPRPGLTGSRLAVAARYYFPRDFFDLLSTERNKNTEGEMGVSESIQAWIDRGGQVFAHVLDSRALRLDCGSPNGYKQAREVFG